METKEVQMIACSNCGDVKMLSVAQRLRMEGSNCKSCLTGTMKAVWLNPEKLPYTFETAEK